MLNVEKYLGVIKREIDENACASKSCLIAKVKGVCKGLMAKLVLYDYDVGMYRNVGYKCSNCGVEFGNNIYVYIGTPTFEMERKQFSYCPNCGKPLNKLKGGGEID